MEQTNMIGIPSGTMKKIARNLYFREKMKDAGCPNGMYVARDRIKGGHHRLHTDNFELACVRRDEILAELKARFKSVKTKNKEKIQKAKEASKHFIAELKKIRAIEKEALTKYANRKEVKLFGFTITITKS